MIRTLSKENTIHMMNLSCMVMAWGVTSFYFEAAALNNMIYVIGETLLLPVYFFENLIQLFSNETISGHPLRMFFVLWISYTLLFIHFYPLLMVRNHAVSDLKEWYEKKI